MLDDLTITRLCAEAMGLSVKEFEDEQGNVLELWEHGDPVRTYNPLTDDAQCFALVKKMKLGIEPADEEGEDHYVYSTDRTPMIRTWDTDLNRAICLAVAQMWRGQNG